MILLQIMAMDSEKRIIFTGKIQMMDTKRILVVDDEQDLCDILVFNLNAAGYTAHTVHSAEAALELDMSDYDLLLVDVMMEGMSGFDLVRRLKMDAQTARVPIIFLTAKDGEEDTLYGFSIGADDYVTKPFSVREVLARVKAVLNRMSPVVADEAARVLVHESLSMDVMNKTVTVDGESISLTKTEFELLRLFLSNRGEVFTRQQVIERVWPPHVIVSDRTVDVNIARMRKKIGRYSSCIVTRQGFGYMFKV